MVRAFTLSAAVVLAFLCAGFVVPEVASAQETVATPAPGGGENLLPGEWCPTPVCYKCQATIAGGQISITCVTDPHGRTICTIVHEAGNISCQTSGAFCDTVTVTP